MKWYTFFASSAMAGTICEPEPNKILVLLSRHISLIAGEIHTTVADDDYVLVFDTDIGPPLCTMHDLSMKFTSARNLE